MKIKDKLNITGVADSNDSVSTFMRNLDASAWLANPKLSIIDSARKAFPNSSWFQLEVTQTRPKKQSEEG